MTRELTVLASGGAYFEAPRWHDGMWWTSDLYRKAIFTYSVEGREDNPRRDSGATRTEYLRLHARRCRPTDASSLRRTGASQQRPTFWS